MAFGILYGLRLSGIYKITNTKNGKFYVGSSVQIESRIFKHLALLRKRKHKNGHMQAAFVLHGEDAFDFTLVEACEKSSLLAREQHYIDVLHPEYNICKVAGNTLGVLHTDQAKAKMTAANLGNKHMLGKHHSEETKQKLRDAAALRTITPETRTKISKSLLGNKRTLGRVLSDEHRESLLKALRDAWNGIGNVNPRSRQEAADRVRARWACPIWKAAQSEKIRLGKAKRLAEKGNHFGDKIHGVAQNKQTV